MRSTFDKRLDAWEPRQFTCFLRNASRKSFERSYLESVHDNWWGMWGICGEYSRDLLQDTLPDDVSVVNGRVHIAITVLLPYPHTGRFRSFPRGGLHLAAYPSPR